MESEAKVEIVDLTRELAQELAEHIPPYQRGVRPKWVTALIADINEGRWRLGDSAIVLAEDHEGRMQLQNGQHRVLARLEADTDEPCPVILLTRTVDDIEDYLATDAGKKRSFPDYLRLRGEANINQAASIIRCIGLTREGGIPGFTLTQKSDITHAEMAAIYHGLDRPVFDEAVRHYSRATTLFGGTAATRLAGLYYLIKTEAPELDIDGFLDSVELGLDDDDIGIENPVDGGILLRHRLLRWQGTDRPPTRTLISRSILKAWNMYLTGERGLKFNVPKSNVGLEIIPDWAKE